MAQKKMIVSGNGMGATSVVGALCLLLSLSVSTCSGASRAVDSADLISQVVVDGAGGRESGSISVSGQNRQPKFVINGPESIPPIQLDRLFFPNQTADGGNSTSGTSPFPIGQVATTVTVAKTILVAILAGLKAALPQAILVTAIFAFLITGIAFFVCSITECGVTSPLTVRGSSPFENDVLNRNSYEYDYDKFRPVYHAIDDHKYKYNQIHQDKEFYGAPSN